jgi:DNA invertase Pin-like site-specific DNA recombinase
MPTLAYPYLRYSSARQKDGDSERRQGDWFAEVCKREGWQIDRSFPLEDKGKSAYHGEHLKANLGRFLEAVNAGRVPRGSVLLVEELDRLSRQERKKALPLVMGLLSAGIDIRTRDRHYTEDSLDDLGAFIDITIRQGAANEESRKKSMRVGENWAAWRARVAKGEKLPPPGWLPPWVDWDNGKGQPLGLSRAARKERGVVFRGFVLVPEAAAAVRFIFDEVAAGLSLRRVLARLNGKDGGKPVPTIGHCPTWRPSYLAKLLNWRAVLGDVEDVTGAVHKGLYPAVVDEPTYYKVRAVLEARRPGNKGVGRPVKGPPNLFAGLLVNARDGGRLYAVVRGQPAQRSLVSSRALHREPGADPTLFPYAAFEEGVLKELREIDPAKVLDTPAGPDEVMVLSGKLRAAEENVAAVNAALDEHGETPEMLARLHKRTTERDKIAADLAGARARAAHPLSESWGEAKALLGALTDEARRLRFRSELQRIVEEVRCLFVKNGPCKLAAVQMFFSGGRARFFVIRHRPTFTKRPARPEALSFVEVIGKEDLDLRKRDHARRLEKALAAAPLERGGGPGA